ncbi:energy-coupling factor transporter transmembrane protein EcfT [Achromobacter sp. LC458]|uniref:Energy-coupling factor transporter transmembrane protein EcfT n=1 Tax=Achromobacter spanius TaxID=217203 RepID=A0A2S5GUR2_9BURK|nr:MULTISPECIES: energy-coupling factor transporter transmembrane protein EcfT [Achromobacter]AYD63474.1 energy-coupling factor transporter transmembrane protein EcfT [Achromobacter sp. B7]MDX3985507.1 energy-coupling factor transporter transmembrane protein EcfT [Achromobacter sp.]PPA76593.1 energy-coupling factor transporter transmembrane protein EcfT [Achromobacter spanius]QYJ22846.1 energy-coupling factor transporter transmembrane protein EcfT [Achromobacter sp. ES-001]TRM54755.1 energy-co
MIEPLYVAGRSPLHRLPAWVKLVALVAAGAGLFMLRDPRWLGAAFTVSAILVWSTGVSAAAVWRQVRGLLWVLLAVALFTGVFQGLIDALAVVLRVGAMVGLALAVTLATRTSDLIAVCERALTPFERIGLVDAGKVALALALTLRFVPEIWRNFQDIREAQAARGLGAHPVALIVPLIVLTLKRAQEVAEAIDARSP